VVIAVEEAIVPSTTAAETATATTADNQLTQTKNDPVQFTSGSF
jgi:hypothetical protein